MLDLTVLTLVRLSEWDDISCTTPCLSLRNLPTKEQRWWTNSSTDFLGQRLSCNHFDVSIFLARNDLCLHRKLRIYIHWIEYVTITWSAIAWRSAGPDRSPPRTTFSGVCRHIQAISTNSYPWPTLQRIWVESEPTPPVHSSQIEPIMEEG